MDIQKSVPESVQNVYQQLKAAIGGSVGEPKFDETEENYGKRGFWNIVINITPGLKLPVLKQPALKYSYFEFEPPIVTYKAHIPESTEQVPVNPSMAKMAYMLDKVADSLEAQGLIKEALDVDKISDMLK